MKAMNHLFALFVLAATLMGTRQAFADAELRLYDGDHEWDLKDRIVILSRDGSALDFQYKKNCSAYSACKSVRANSDQDAQLARIDAGQLSMLNAAIAALAGENPVSANPAKSSLCKQFRRFVYEVRKESGAVIQSEQFKGCTGTRLSDPNALVIEKILNIAAESAGL